MINEKIDITGKIGDLFPSDKPEWPMYSYSRPSYLLWNAIANGLHDRGWTEKRIKDWLQSKSPRWALDRDLGSAIEELGRKFSSSIE